MGRVITNSRAVADYFEKRHADVLRDIRALDCSPQFHERNFAPFKINDLTGTSTSHYEMTRDGFFFLAMGYTGPRAARLKEAYISRFNEMEETLRNAHRTGYLGQVVVKEFALTVSSREIAELTGELHKHIIRDIVVMFSSLGIIGSKSGLSDFLGSYIDTRGRSLPLYNLPKRETLILVSGYSVELRARIIDRWMELQRQLPRTLGGRRLPPTLGKTRRGGRPTWRMNGNRG